MIQIEIYLAPHGDTKNRKLIAAGEIANDGTGTQTLGNYKYVLMKKTKRSAKVGEIKGFHRKVNDVWHLLHLILNNIAEERFEKLMEQEP